MIKIQILLQRNSRQLRYNTILAKINFFARNYKQRNLLYIRVQKRITSCGDTIASKLQSYPPFQPRYTTRYHRLASLSRTNTSGPSSSITVFHLSNVSEKQIHLWKRSAGLSVFRAEENRLVARDKAMAVHDGMKTVHGTKRAENADSITGRDRTHSCPRLRPQVSLIREIRRTRGLRLPFSPTRSHLSLRDALRLLSR